MNLMVMDIETSGLEINCDINFIGFYNGEKYYILNCIGKPDKEIKEKLQEIINKMIAKNYKFVFHNGKFDTARILYKYGINIPINHDVMILAYLCANASELREHRQKLLGLKNLAQIILRAPDWNISLDKKKSTDPEEVIPYLKKDLKYTYELYQVLSKRIPETRKKTYGLIMLALEVYKKIEVNGLPINSSRLKETHKEISLALDALYKRRMAHYNINFNSSKQLSKLLYEDLKLVPTKYTKNGQPSTDIEALTDQLGKHEIIEDILDYRGYRKAIEFLEDWDKKRIGDKIHANFNLHTTITGRTSCNSPNLQQIPRDKKLKTLFKSTDPEWEFVQMDYSQIELRVAAVVANVSNMKRIFVNNEDMHTNTAAIIAGKKPEEVTKEERTHAKSANFGYLYGMQANTFTTYAKLNYGVVFSLEEAQKIRNAFFNANYELINFYQEVETELTTFGKVTSLLNREYEVDPDLLRNRYWRSEWTRRAINFKVQSTASDIALCALVEIDQKVNPDRVKICGTVHDSILFLVKKTPYFEQDIKQIQKIMENPTLVKHLIVPGMHIDVPIRADIEIGPWGDGVSLEEYLKATNEESVA